MLWYGGGGGDQALLHVASAPSHAGVGTLGLVYCLMSTFHGTYYDCASGEYLFFRSTLPQPCDFFLQTGLTGEGVA